MFRDKALHPSKLVRPWKLSAALCRLPSPHPTCPHPQPAHGGGLGNPLALEVPSTTVVIQGALTNTGYEKHHVLAPLNLTMGTNDETLVGRTAC